MSSPWLAEAAAVFVKEWRSELRGRSSLATLALFAVTTLVVLSLALGPVGVSRANRLWIAPAILWILLFFAAALGLPRAFVHEEESRTAIARLGAVQEGIFRKHSLTQHGFQRDTVYFSIIDNEWPAVKAGLEAMLQR